MIIIWVIKYIHYSEYQKYSQHLSPMKKINLKGLSLGKLS